MNPRLVSLNTALGIPIELIVSRGLHVCEEASCFEVAEVGADGRDHLLVAAAAEAWRNLKIAAHNDGVALFIVSAFRSIDRQTEIIRRKIEAGMAVEEILTVSAPPGFSEHHTGRAVDITTPGSRALEVEFDQTAAFTWLNARAAEFGYYLSYPIDNHCGYQYEPWHWCFNDAQITLCCISQRRAMVINLEGVVSANWRNLPANEIFPGVRKRNLWQGTNGAKSLILEIDAGAKFTTLDIHSPGPEEVFVVSGVFNDGVHDYPAGTFIHNPAGSAHVPQSKQGCVIFVFFSEG